MTSIFLAEANKLKNIQTNLEKNEYILLEHIKKYSDSKIAEYYEQLELERKKELGIMQKEIIGILNPLNKFKTLTLGSKVENLDYRQIKKDMTLLAENIKCFGHKTKQYLEKLKEEENKHNNDIKTYESKMIEWEKHINLTHSNYNKNVVNKNHKVEQNVTDFLTYLTKNGGHTNGWSSDDHNLFLKARSRCADINELCIYLHAILPDICEDEIRLHEKWYLKYLELKQKQRQAIKTWRKAKSAVIINKEPNEDKRAASAYSKEKIMSRHEIRQKLEKWKREKSEKEECEKLLNCEMEKQRKEERERRKQKREEIKKIIDNWKVAKLEKEEIELYEKQTIEKQQRIFKSAMANRLIKEFQSQDEIFLRRRIESCKPKAKSVEKIWYNNLQISRDPDRLLKPTKQWISRIRSNDENKQNNNPANIKNISKLGLPEWRKNVSVVR